MKFTPENVARVFVRVNEEASKKGYEVILRMALAVEKQAKINLSGSSHQYGTPTPARPGTGPAIISGTLRRSVTHSTPTPTGLASWQAKVGLGGGFYPPYARGASKTDSAHYGRYLETGDTRNGAAYPFLGPAAKFGHRIAGPVIYRDVFGRWPRMDY